MSLETRLHRYSRAKSRRKRWDAGERPRCAIHPERVVSLVAWLGGHRRCEFCVRAEIKKKHRSYGKPTEIRVWRAPDAG